MRSVMFDTTSTEAVDLVQREIITGLSQCKSVDEIASDILCVLNVSLNADRPVRHEMSSVQ